MQSLSLQGKVALITGATNGIGLSTARELARLGATTIIVGRSPEKAERVVAAIRAETASESVHKAIADLSSQADIRELAAQFLARYDRLDILVNNAGAIYNVRQQSVDGIEMTFALNHLNYFLLTNLLVDRLKASAPARIINVSSGAHQFARGGMHWHDLELRQGYGSMKAYGQSKLANILFTRELARRLEGTGVTANVMHPGFVATGFGRNNSGLLDLFYQIVAPFIRTPDKGAETVIWLASAPYSVQPVPQRRSISASWPRAASRSPRERYASPIYSRARVKSGLAASAAS